ncbi:hypothetical protein H5J25_10330 [Sphingomonas aliaeris]|uniref:Uncharacterized protein n=1 Tax=Sphingomonas aliaeris TaxID=2759526 RepID=A0A974NSD8_9SPHN|nr:hypothetical protein [Sphingomonas aliaeris]QQV75983.1 hypothetical protein H5J25_10330 [Sphingomonas aliaeris]
MRRSALGVLALPMLVAASPAPFPPAAVAPDRWADRPHGPTYPTAPAMHDTVERRLIPQLEKLLVQLLRDRRDMTLGGVKVFESGDKFLPGKIATAMSYRILDLPKTDPRLPQRLADFAAIADLTVDDTNDSWGIYYYVSALHRLNEAGLLDRAVRPATLARLRAKLDWRRFVRPDLTLIDLPNNYYGVAFSIARLRYLLGWEDAKGSDALLARTLDHYRRYSGTYGFADETEGEGRFDRYSVLLIGEIAQRLVETGMTPSKEVKGWLRRSVDLMLPRFNMEGEGFEYGRSIGPYGETAFLEVLTAAARLKVLTPVEERMAYAFSSRIAARYMNFWVSPDTGSVDMWGQGRRTDAYRGTHRIFGENLSLARQYIYTNVIWNDLGYRGKAPAGGEYARWLKTLPRLTTTWFARGTYDRAVVTIRDGGHVISLPIINGAGGQHMNNPYFPVPFSPGMLQGAADAQFPQLLPRITLTDNSVLMPLAYFKDLKVVRKGTTTEVRWRQDALDLMSESNARADTRVSIVTRYVFTPGHISRRDTITASKPVKRIDVEFATFSKHPSVRDARVAFGRGEVSGFSAQGYDECAAKQIQADPYRATTGPFNSLISCKKMTKTTPATSPSETLIGWDLSYNMRNLR